MTLDDYADGLRFGNNVRLANCNDNALNPRVRQGKIGDILRQCFDKVGVP